MLITVLAIQLSLSYLPTTVTGSYVPFLDLLPRANADCPASYTSCGNSQLPPNFCCPTSTTCISLDNSSSAICCPSGSDCSFIKPITCDIQAQNATANPEAALKTTRLTDSLPKCGGSCCPFGYTCQDGSTCALIKDTSSEAPSSTQSSASSALSTSSTSASSASATSAPSAPSATSSTAAPTSTLSIVPSSTPTSFAGLAPNSTQITQTCPAFPVTAVVAGFFPGLVSGALAAAIITICLRRRKQTETSKQARLRRRSSGGTIIDISDPMPSDVQSTFRTDFLLRKGSSRYPDSVRSKSILRRTGTRVKSFFGSNPSPKLNGGSSDPSPPPPPVPVTPPQQIRPRQPSTESIKVYSPASMLASSNLRPGVPNTQPDRPNTTFSEVMEKVGFQNQRGEPYFRVTETPAPQSRSPLRNG